MRNTVFPCGRPHWGGRVPQPDGMRSICKWAQIRQGGALSGLPAHEGGEGQGHACVPRPAFSSVRSVSASRPASSLSWTASTSSLSSRALAARDSRSRAIAGFTSPCTWHHACSQDQVWAFSDLSLLLCLFMALGVSLAPISFWPLGPNSGHYPHVIRLAGWQTHVNLSG